MLTRDLLRVAPARRDHWPATRIALGVALPLLLLLALNRLDLSVYAAFGAFTGIYGRHEPQRSRLVHQAQAAALLCSCVALGLLLAHSGLGGGVTVAVTAVVSLVTAVLGARLGLRPAGALFFVFALAVVASVAHPPSYLLGTGVALASASLSVALGWLGAHVSGRRRPEELAPALPASLSSAELGRYGLRHLLAVGLAGALSLRLGLHHTDWAMVAAAAPVGVLGHQARVQRSLHRIFGTLGGVGITGLLLALPLHPWQMAGLIVLLQFMAEIYIARNYGLALLFITPLALLMSQLAHPSASLPLLTARAGETALGAAVGLAVVLLLQSDS
ncbi:FUSC family protein [Deinococcus sp. Marseille-Q6407]|uniref:FUSC family protein n=1 Tax=Deinococcus sp. Marseille-Q6407 TaxID=2969223 RepID=UPI0021C0410D|nr:FUSC family protein [Deinococcus sp. Marseille-Q6407]